jgi:hypothetical protein
MSMMLAAKFGMKLSAIKEGIECALTEYLYYHALTPYYDALTPSHPSPLQPTPKTHSGGQGQFGAISPSDWKVPGTSPVGENSFGKADGADEPWFSEAVSTVEMDLAKGAETMEAFTMQAADFKVAKFADTKPYDWKSNDAGKKELIEALGGLAKFLDAGDKPIAAAWDKLHPDPVKVEAEKKKAEVAAKKKAEEAAAKKAEEAEAK